MSGISTESGTIDSTIRAVGKPITHIACPSDDIGFDGRISAADLVLETGHNIGSQLLEVFDKPLAVFALAEPFDDTF